MTDSSLFISRVAYKVNFLHTKLIYDKLTLPPLEEVEYPVDDVRQGDLVARRVAGGLAEDGVQFLVAELVLVPPPQLRNGHLVLALLLLVME